MVALAGRVWRIDIVIGDIQENITLSQIPGN
jgi:hypothetical protein